MEEGMIDYYMWEDVYSLSQKCVRTHKNNVFRKYNNEKTSQYQRSIIFTKKT